MGKYWINTVSLDHVQGGVEGGFTQADHGKSTRLSRLSRGDWLVFYSPKTAYQGGKALQQFTALGQIADDEPYQVEMSPGFLPWRRKMKFESSTPADIRPLLEGLEFVPDKKRWGLPFRRGIFEIEEHDFRLIAEAMGVKI